MAEAALFIVGASGVGKTAVLEHLCAETEFDASCHFFDSVGVPTHEEREAMGLTPMMATELEFFLFEGTYEENARRGFRELTPVSTYNEDYHILQTSKEERVMRPLRNHLFAAGVPVVTSDGSYATFDVSLTPM